MALVFTPSENMEAIKKNFRGKGKNVRSLPKAKVCHKSCLNMHLSSSVSSSLICARVCSQVLGLD